MSNDIFNRFNTSKNYERHLFRAAKGLQSAELNEIQSALMHRLQGVSDVLFKDGDVLSGAQPLLAEDGTLTLFDNILYVRGAARGVPETTITVPMTGVQTVGAYLQETTITELEDPELRDPAVGTRNYQEAGAARLQVLMVWGLAGDGTEGDFYPVYTVQDGVLLQNAPPPELDGVLQLVARYDRNSNGSYIIDGMTSRYIGEANGEQVFSVSEGQANVEGYEVQKINATRLTEALAPDTDDIIGEPHTFNDSGDGTAVIELNKGPIAQVNAVRVTKRTTTTLTHGAFTGSSDALPDDSVLGIVEVTQGGTTYVSGDDFLFGGDEIDWSPAGQEPAPSSTYQITYDHIVTIVPVETTDTTVTIDTALDGTIAYFDYDWKMPRIDAIAIDQTGIVKLIKGQPSKFDPKPASVPNNLLALALVFQTWSGSPDVVNNGVKVTPMSEIEAMKNSISDLYDLVAQERLRNDANIADPAAKKGVFVDPFIDDDLRDQGETQTAAIVDGELMLAIDAEIDDVSSTMAAVETLPFEYEALIEQDMGTGQMKINPYQAFDPIPAKVRLNAAVDRFTQVQSVWRSPITRRVWVWSNSGQIANGRLLSTRTSTRVTNSRTVGEAEFLRQINVNVTVEGFGAGEEIAQILFDGIDVTPA